MGLKVGQYLVFWGHLVDTSGTQAKKNDYFLI